MSPDRIIRKSSRHSLSTVDGGAWKIRPPGGYDWYYILFAPGVVVLAGDLGDIRLTHFGAMPTLEAALPWLVQSDTGYLLQKSDQRRELDRAQTARDLARFCRECPDLRVKAIRVLKDVPTIAAFSRHLGSLGRDEIARLCVSTLEIDDYYGATNYTDGSRRMIRVIKDWARMMMSAQKPNRADVREAA